MTNSDATSLTLKGQLIGNAPTFTSTSGNISSRALTTASTAWTPSTWSSGSDYNSPDISAVVQEIVNQGAWASGTVWRSSSPGTGHRASQAYDTDPSTAAQLVVTYTVSAAPTVANLAGDAALHRWRQGGRDRPGRQRGHLRRRLLRLRRRHADRVLRRRQRLGRGRAGDPVFRAPAPGQIGVSGRTSATVARSSAVSPAAVRAPLVVTLNANANPTSATALMRNITTTPTPPARRWARARCASCSPTATAAPAPTSTPASRWAEFPRRRTCGVKTTGNATSSVGSGNLSWTDGVAVNFGNPNLRWGEGTHGRYLQHRIRHRRLRRRARASPGCTM